VETEQCNLQMESNVMMETVLTEMVVATHVRMNLDQYVDDLVDKLQHQLQVKHVLLDHWFDRSQKYEINGHGHVV
jgi:hypothetical protein